MTDSNDNNQQQHSALLSVASEESIKNPRNLVHQANQEEISEANFRLSTNTDSLQQLNYSPSNEKDSENPINGIELVEVVVNQDAHPSSYREGAQSYNAPITSDKVISFHISYIIISQN